MKRLKKLLAISLVLIMMMGMVPFAGAQATVVRGIDDFTDADDINYWEAVAVLTQIRVLEGFPDGRFDPQGSFTRAQAAAIIARVNLARHVTEMLPAAPTGFADVPATHWASRYVAFAVEQGIIVGFPDGTFRPDATVTGTQFAAMLLRSLGYGALGEFEGPAWELNVIITATTRQQQHAGFVIPWLRGPILSGGADFTAPATREQVAYYALNAMRWNDVIFGTEVAAGQVLQTYVVQPTVMMTRVHQLTDNWELDGFGRPYTHWRWVPPGRVVAEPLGIDVPFVPDVRWTSRQTVAAVGTFVRDNPFITAGVPVQARTLFENGRLAPGGVSTVNQIQELTNNGVEVDVYLHPHTGYIWIVTVIQTDLYRVITQDTANRRVVLEQVSNSMLTNMLGATFNVAYDAVALDNEMYEYLRALPAGGDGTGAVVLVVAQFDTATGQMEPYSAQRPTVIEGILNRANLGEYTLTVDDTLYSMAAARHNTINVRVTPHATNTATLHIDNFGFVVDVRTAPTPDRVHHIMLTQTGLSIPRPGPAGTTINYPAVRGVTSLGHSVVIEVTNDTTAMNPGELFSAVWTGTRYTLTELNTTAVVASTGEDREAPLNVVLSVTGANAYIPARATKLIDDMQPATQYFGNNLHASVNYIYVWQMAGAGSPWTFQVRTGPQASPIDLTEATWASAVVQNTGTEADPIHIVRAVFIYGPPGVVEPSDLVHIGRGWANRVVLGGDEFLVEAWRGSAAVAGGLHVRGVYDTAHRFFIPNTVGDVTELWQVTSNYVSNAVLQAMPNEQPFPLRVAGATGPNVGVDGGFTVAGATVVDTRPLEERNAAPITPSLAGIRTAINNDVAPVFSEIRVSFAYTAEGRAPILFISNATAEGVADLPDGIAVFSSPAIDVPKEVPVTRSIAITLRDGYTFVPNIASTFLALEDWLTVSHGAIASTAWEVTGASLNTARTVLTINLRIEAGVGTGVNVNQPGGGITAVIPQGAIQHPTATIPSAGISVVGANPLNVMAISRTVSPTMLTFDTGDGPFVLPVTGPGNRLSVEVTLTNGGTFAPVGTAADQLHEPATLAALVAGIGGTLPTNITAPTAAAANFVRVSDTTLRIYFAGTAGAADDGIMQITIPGLAINYRTADLPAVNVAWEIE